jgi:integrase
MAIVKRNGYWFIYFRPFRDKKIGIKLLNVTSKVQASQVETLILMACRSGDYSGLDSLSREACIRMFTNQKWELPPDLCESCKPQKELTLWDASRIFLTYPEISEYSARWRYECALGNLIEKLGKNTPIKSIWIPRLKVYQIERLRDEAAPATINRELSTLSRLFGVLIENQLLDTNPVRLLKSLSCKSGEREVYLSFQDVNRMAEHCPEWFKSIIWTAYYTGMRRGELLGLIRKQVNLTSRIIYLKPDQTKEGNPKRIPIHRDLVPILSNVLKITSIGTERVFLIQDQKGVRSIGMETFKNCWPRACESLKLEKPWPRFHDLRATWRTNARRSGVDGQVAESIMGHWYKQKSVNDRYGRIGDKELLDAIDKMTFDHGETEILVSSPSKKVVSEKR